MDCLSSQFVVVFDSDIYYPMNTSLEAEEGIAMISS